MHKDEHSISDAKLDGLLHAHFTQQDDSSTAPPPAFNTMWKRAETEVEQQSIIAPATLNSWYAPAIAALVLIASGALLTPEFLGRQQTDAALSEETTSKLFDELSRTTH